MREGRGAGGGRFSWMGHVRVGGGRGRGPAAS